MTEPTMGRWWATGSVLSGDSHSTVQALSSNTPPCRQSRRAGKFFHAGRTFRALARKWDFSAQHPRGFGSPQYCPLGLRETPYTTFSGLPPSISKHTASLLPWKGGYIPYYKEGVITPSHGRPETSASPTWVSAAVTGTFHTLLSVYLMVRLFRTPQTSLPDSTINGSFLRDPHSPDNPTTKYTIILLMEICTPQCVSFAQTNTVNSDKSRNHINR